MYLLKSSDETSKMGRGIQIKRFFSFGNLRRDMLGKVVEMVHAIIPLHYTFW